MKLNLGSDEVRLPGYVNVDMSDKAEMKVDLRFFPWPWMRNEADEIMASHILEHLAKRDAIMFLVECHRILKPGGKLYIAVPDLDKFIRARLTGRWDDIIGDYAWRDLNYFMGGDESETRPNWRHRYMYTYESLAYILETYCGFEVVAREMLPIDTPDYERISLYVTATKVEQE